jgi:hypothetical protein
MEAVDSFVFETTPIDRRMVRERAGGHFVEVKRNMIPTGGTGAGIGGRLSDRTFGEAGRRILEFRSWGTPTLMAGARAGASGKARRRR